MSTELFERLSSSQEIRHLLLETTVILGAQRVDGGNAFHISTILLKKLNLKMSVLAWFFSSTQSSLPLIAGVSIRIRVKVNKRRNVYIYVPIKNFINKKRLSCIQVSAPVLEINLVALR